MSTVQDLPSAGLTAYIYRNDHGSCSGDGISARCSEVTVVGVRDADGQFTPAAPVFTADETRPAVILVKRRMGARTIVHAEPVGKPAGAVGPMMGGCYISTSDSRFSDMAGMYGAVSLHDRFETPAQYASYD